MKRKSASTLIYFTERVRRKSLVKHPKHVNKEKRVKKICLTLRLAVLAAFVVSGTWFYVKYHPFNVTSVEIVGAQRFVNAQDVREIVEEKSLGRNLIFIDSKRLGDVVASNFLASKSAKVVRRFPKSLRVEIVERTPIALILPPNEPGPSDKKFYFVDSEGFVLGLADKSATNLPVINYSQEVEVGRFIEEGTVSYYFDLIKSLDEDEVFVSTISSYPRYTQFFTRENNQVLFSNTQPAKSQVKIFTQMMKAFKAEGKEVKKIDLRFDKVIVEFSN